MPNYNKIIMMGHLTRAPQLKYTPSQMAVVEFGIASNHKYKDREEVCFIDCTSFGAQAEVIDKHCSKGDALLVEGRLKQEQWEKDGQKRCKHCIIVEKFSFVGGENKKQSQKTEPSAPNNSNYEPFDENDEIPF